MQKKCHKRSVYFPSPFYISSNPRFYFVAVDCHCCLRIHTTGKVWAFGNRRFPPKGAEFSEMALRVVTQKDGNFTYLCPAYLIGPACLTNYVSWYGKKRVKGLNNLGRTVRMADWDISRSPTIRVDMQRKHEYEHERDRESHTVRGTRSQASTSRSMWPVELSIVNRQCIQKARPSARQTATGASHDVSTFCYTGSSTTDSRRLRHGGFVFWCYTVGFSSYLRRRRDANREELLCIQRLSYLSR